MTWIDQVLQATDDAECPKKFMRWACLSAISAAAKRRVYLNRGGVYRLYPNLYVLLIADSGFRKSYAPMIAEQITGGIPWIRCISGSNTIQKILHKLAGPIPGVNGQKVDTDASAFLTSGEFTNLIKADRQAMTMLTELYDASYKTKWKYDTKNAGEAELHNVCLTMLGATTRQHFNEYFEEKDITGGFLARTVIIHVKDLDKLNPLTDDTRPIVDVSPFVPYLEKLGALPDGSQMRLLPDAKTLFETWYLDFFNPANLKKLHDKTNFIMRSQDHILKVAMLLSLARDLSLEITKDDIEEAMDEVFNSARDINGILFGRPATQASPMGLHYKNVLDILLNAPGNTMTRDKLLQRLYGELDSQDLNRVVQGMEESGWLKIHHSGAKTTYTVDKKIVDQYLDFKAKKGKP